MDAINIVNVAVCEDSSFRAMNCLVKTLDAEVATLTAKVAEQADAISTQVAAIAQLNKTLSATKTGYDRRTWQVGDILCCTDSSGFPTSCEVITNGEFYTLVSSCGDLGIVDDQGDFMVAVVQHGHRLSFYHRPHIPVKVTSTIESDWRTGDSVVDKRMAECYHRATTLDKQ